MTPDNGLVPYSPLSLTESLTFQWYSWELRGRGWDVWPAFVDIEPPFAPFQLKAERRICDDAREPGLWERAMQWLRPAQPQIQSESLPPDDAIDVPDFLPADDRPYIVEWRMALPEGYRPPPEAMKQWLLSLAYLSGPVAFEIVGNDGAVWVQIACREADASWTKRQFEACFPEIVATAPEHSLKVLWFSRLDAPALVADFGLDEEFCRPLRARPGHDPDPLVGVYAALAGLGREEVGVYQVLFQPVRHPWAEQAARAMHFADGSPFFADAPEMVSLARAKLAAPLCAAVLRIAVKGPEPDRAMAVLREAGGALTAFDDPASNRLAPLANDEYPQVLHEIGLLNRCSCRSGMLLNVDELVALAHPPAASVRIAGLQRLDRRTKAAPEAACSGSCVLGANIHNGEVRQVALSSAQRTQHMHVVGASGTGKSTLLLAMMAQDMEQGAGFALLDPHGDLVDDALARVPTHRLDDVVLFDPSDAEYPVGLNILSAHSELEKTLLASDFVSVFRRLSTSWGDQMTTVLANAVLAFLESPQGGTLLDLRRFLVEKDFRNQYVKTIADPEIRYYWEREFPLLTGKPQGPILTRLDAFLRPKLIRRMVAQKENRLDFASFMDHGTIFLAKLSQGAIGEENAYLLGSLLVSKFQQVALARQEKSASERPPYLLYIDEFHHFVTPTMATLLSGARKYGLGLVLAHQEMRQLQSRDGDVASAVLTNPYTRVCFRVGDQDARSLAEGFASFEAGDLTRLGRGEAVCRIERSDWDFTLRTNPVAETGEAERLHRMEAIRTRSRALYARSLAEVEAMAAAAHPPSLPREPRGAPAEKTIPAANAPDTAGEPPEPLESHPPAAEVKRPQKRAGPADPGYGLMGKGGQEHRYLQNFIKRWAEGMGYRASIEKPLDNGGSVDVALEKGDLSIACEISVSTTPAHELSNIEKCLDAGFTHVAAIATDRKKLAGISAAARERFSEEAAARLHAFTVEELCGFIEELEARAASTEKTVRGYRVKVNYSAPGKDDKQARTRAVSQVIAKAMQRMRKDRE